MCSTQNPVFIRQFYQFDMYSCYTAYTDTLPLEFFLESQVSALKHVSSMSNCYRNRNLSCLGPPQCWIRGSLAPPSQHPAHLSPTHIYRGQEQILTVRKLSVANLADQ
jgi:hypothetical protein